MARSSTNSQPFSLEDVTVNINTVNRPEYLRACLESLLQTTPRGVPLQIAFNGTPDDVRERTIAQASRWQGPTNFLVYEELLPIAESHNRALDAIETPLVNFMGDDDLVLGNRLPLLIDAFNSHVPRPLAVTSYAHRIAGDATGAAGGSLKTLGPVTLEEWRNWHASGRPFEMLWPGAVLDTEALRGIGGVEEQFDLVFDTRVFSQLSFIGPVLSIEDANFGVRVHSGSISTSNWSAQREKLRYLQRCHSARLAAEEPPSFESFLAEENRRPWHERLRCSQGERSLLFFRQGGEHLLSGQRLGGLGYLALSALSSPATFGGKLRQRDLV